MTEPVKSLDEMNNKEVGIELIRINERIRALSIKKDEILELLRCRQNYIAGILATCHTSTVIITSDSPLTELKFQKRFETRIQRRFRDGGMRTVGDLIAVGETTLYAPDFGKKSIDEIKRVLASHGITLPRFSSR